MGLIRFLLSIIVVLGHSGAVLRTVGGLGAVEAFFILSGTFMAATYARNYANTPYSGLRFFASRYFRLWPSYITLVILTFMAYKFSFKTNNETYIYNYFIEDQSLLQSVSMITLIGQDILSINSPTDLSFPVRQSWSISAELVFYALVPFLFYFRSKIKWILFISLFIKIVFQPTNVVELSFYGHNYSFAGWRLAYFPFWAGFFYFCLGFYLRQINSYLRISDIETATALKPISIALFVLLAFFPQDPSWFMSTGSHNNILFDLILVFLIATFFEVKDSRVEAWLGSLSYHIYLSHFLFIQLARQVLGRSLEDSLGNYIGSLAFSSVIILLSTIYAAAFEIIIQKYVDNLRTYFFKKSV